MVTWRRAAATVGLLSILLVRPALVSAAVWNPFVGSERVSLVENFQKLLKGLLAEIEDLTSTVVSKFRLPNSSLLGARADNVYKPPTPGGTLPATTGVRTDITTPAPRPGDMPSHADAFWASDCSCVKSTGAKAGITYEVSNRCPEDESKRCEECRKITRHDNLVKTVAECRAHGFVGN